MTDAMTMFKATITIMLFYSLGITLLTYSLDPLTVGSWEEVFGAPAVDIGETGQDIQDSLETQLDIPIVDLGALVFYSGNILVDMILNFLFAVPEMIGLLFTGFTAIFSLDAQLAAQVQLFAFVLTVATYVIGVIELLTSIRARGSIV